MFGIYMNRYPTSVLLTDGAFMNEMSCYKESWHIPKLFATAGGAKNFLHKSGRIRKHYTIKKYAGATQEQR